MILFYDDFSNFEIGEFPYDADHSALGEYQFIKPVGNCGSWVDQVCNHTWNGSGATWIITENNDICDIGESVKSGKAVKRKFMEQMRIEKNRPHRIFPTLQTGSIFWHDYNFSAVLRRLSTNGIAGIAFCMQNSLNTLVFQLEKDAETVSLVRRHKEEIYPLAKADFVHNSDDYYKLSVQCIKDEIICHIDDVEILRCKTDFALQGGKIGITADCPTQFTEISVSAAPEVITEISRREKAYHENITALQNKNPKMKLWKKIDLKNFGTSRQIRFGHLKGGDEWHIVLAQAQKRVSRDAYPHISCLTAIDLNGNILWQIGTPSANAQKLGKISADLPFQVYDIDGDGADEVICAINFELLILDGATGKIKRRAKTPLTSETAVIGVSNGIYAFDRLNVDCISFANLKGGNRPREILIKDRYCRLYALDSELNILWKYHSNVNTGHFPLAVDINNDGKDEILCGYHLLNSDGRKLWEYPISSDHVDEIIFGRFSGESEFFACVAGSEGFFIGDTNGNIIFRDKIGHAQRISMGNYDPSRKGFEIAVSNFWGHQGIIYLYDCFGNPILELENELNGNILTPVNWTGDGRDYFMLNADPTHGGLCNGDSLQAVAFPDDGHPTLCCEALNLTGDYRDEIVVWDYKNLWIYTQDDIQDKFGYNPKKRPHYNASNYRGETSGF
ncbi:MAG: hypothetical protein FWD01_03685 [Defluviitaleaceae bacterium]|nr:hypothetical protein [Defluviitaleaceae bacterium]